MTTYANKLEDLIQKMEDIDDDLDTIVGLIVDEEFPFLVKGQLADGETMSGATIQDSYSPSYARRRKKQGLQTNYVDLYFTGEFYEGLKVVDSGSEYYLESDVEYFDHIMNRYGGILGLQKDNMKLLKQRIIFEILKDFKNG